MNLIFELLNYIYNSDVKKLKAKHPAPTASNPPLPDPDLRRPLQVSEDEVLIAMHSFPAGSVGGPDGLRSQHIKEIVTSVESANVILPALTLFC